MAKVTAVVPDETEVIVTKAGSVTVQLTNDEVDSLLTLLHTGVGHGTVKELGLSGLVDVLFCNRDASIVSPLWHTNANLQSVVRP